ncbi:hypothetical protein [Klebsiella quasipneumoniae]|uniref:hypothetical protein n=1 Tax=Klebsiella quasipneumoniae TaxID=1463165 RepID=UPI00296FC503|nr:hypothetical protein [Klebsiella quasipneumoniae]
MGIKFHDFRDDRQTFDREWQATIDMNKWLEDKNIDVISVETIFEVSGSMASTSSRFEAIRFGTKKSARLSERWNELSKLGMLVNLFT